MNTFVNILEEIAEKTKKRVIENKAHIPFDEMKLRALKLPSDTGYPFEKAIGEAGLSFICEVKKASPSKGLIASDFPYVDIAKEYESAGASAISVLTEPYYFMGSDRYLEEIHDNVLIPLLRKDFTVDEYMIYEAKVIGASAVLLICSILTDEELSCFIRIADSLGLSALVEAHDEAEVERAVKSGARLIGVNNRDLKTFSVDINNSIRLRSLVPPEILFVSESGIKREEDIAKLRENGVDGVLIGEAMMRAGANRAGMLAKLKGIR